MSEIEDSPREPINPKPREDRRKHQAELDNLSADDEQFLVKFRGDSVWFPKFVAKGEEDPSVQPEAEKLEDEVARAKKLRNDRMEQANKQRGYFLWFVIGAVAVPILTASGGFAAIVWRNHELGPEVPIAFFSSVVVEVIALALILANYLFPKGGGIDGKEGDLG